MNICFCVDSMGSGGAERVVANLSNYFVATGHTVSILIISTRSKKSFYQLDDKVCVDSIFDEANQKVGKIKKIKLIKEKIKSVNPNVVISFLPHVNFFTALAIKGLDIPHVVSERNNPYVNPKSKLLRILKEWAFKKADGCVFQTNDAKEYYKNKIKYDAVVIRNPLNLTFTPPNVVCEKTKTVVSVGRLQPQKNYGLLLNAFKLFLDKNEGYVLKIFGDGSQKEELLTLTKDLGITDSVEFLGNCKTWHEQAYNSKMFVLSSDYEGMPNALAEAMAIGIPSISTDCPIGGPRELIEDGINGFLVSVGDKVVLAEKMNILANCEETCNKFSKQNKNLKSLLSIEIIGEQWIEYIKTITK